jgi:hypothetical protein
MKKLLPKFNETYNCLPSVEQASEKLESLNKQEILMSLSEVIIEHDLQNIMGIRLLHNHNLIQDNELMIENDELDSSGNNCLVTFAQDMIGLKKSSPNSWKLEAGDYHPLEYSSDEFVVSTQNLINEKKIFFDDFKIRLEQLQVDDILGPCIVGRNFYQKYQPAMPFILAETSNEERRANIVKFESKDKYDESALISTTWLAVKNEHSDSLETKCVAACIAVSACVKDGNTHRRETRHNKGTHIHS